MEELKKACGELTKAIVLLGLRALAYMVVYNTLAWNFNWPTFSYWFFICVHIVLVSIFSTTITKRNRKTEE